MHSLKTFTAAHNQPVTLLFQAERTDHHMSFCFNLKASEPVLNTLVWPEPKSEQPGRQDELWKTTVFEIFIAEAKKPNYFEFNFSPSWDWAAYSFTEERQGIALVQQIKENPVNKILRKDKEIVFSGTIDLKSLGLSNSIELSPTAILDWNDQLEFWAAEHTTDQPDFHKRDSFVVHL